MDNGGIFKTGIKPAPDFNLVTYLKEQPALAINKSKK
jgi:hypothetical protein